MDAIEAKNFIDNLRDLLKAKLEPGEVCPCCGHRKGKRQASEKMIVANRKNIKLAHAARRKK